MQDRLRSYTRLLFRSLSGCGRLFYSFVYGLKRFFIGLMMLSSYNVTLFIHLEIILCIFFVISSLNFFEHFVDELFLFIILFKCSFDNGGIHLVVDIDVIEYIVCGAIMAMVSGIIECPHDCFIDLRRLYWFLLFRCFGEGLLLKLIIELIDEVDFVVYVLWGRLME